MTKTAILRFSSLCLVGLVLITENSYASVGRKVLRAEKKDSQHTYFHAVEFEKAKFVLKRNSNVFCEPSTKVAIGTFDGEYKEKESNDRDQFELIWVKATRAAHQRKANVANDSNKIFIEGTDVSGITEEPTLRDIVKSSCDYTTLKLKNGTIFELITKDTDWKLKVTPVSGYKELKTSKILSKKQAHCTEDGSVLTCNPQGMGLVKFTRTQNTEVEAEPTTPKQE